MNSPIRVNRNICAVTLATATLLYATIFSSNLAAAEGIKALVRTAAGQPEQVQDFYGPERSTKPWRLCVVLPNISDKLWDEVISGVREESARLGVTSVIYEASGYSEAGLKQQQRILDQRCATEMDAVLLAAVDRSKLHNSLRRLRAQNIVVIDFVNGYEPQEVDARAFTDNYYVGWEAGTEIKRHLNNRTKPSAPATILWIPGPKGPDWAKRGDEGFKDALKNLSVNIETLYLTPHYREQNRDLRQHLSTKKNYDVIVGTGPTSVAVYQLKKEGIIAQDTPVFAYYATPDALQLLAEKQLLGTVSIEPKTQGRLGVALAIGLLEKLPMPFQVGPVPVLLKP